MKVVNSNKLKSRLVELGMTQKDVAKALGVAQPTANQKINNLRPLQLDEVERLAGLLELKASDFREYFFYSTVAQCNKK